MDKALLGVIVGAVIASVVPIIQLIIDHQRWKKERILQLLEEERHRYQKVFDDLMPEIEAGLSNQSWNTMAAEKIIGALPKEVSKPLFDYLHESENRAELKRTTLFQITLKMQQYLAKIDSEKKQLLGA